MAKLRKQELVKAWEAGQAAQRYGDNGDGCPFDQGTEEYDAWFDGFSSELEEKWMTRGGRPLTLNLGD